MAKSYSTLLPSADVESDQSLLSRDIKVNAKTLIGGAAVAAFALGALAATAVAPAVPSAPAAFYNRHHVSAEARREQMDRGDALNWQDIDVRFKLDGTTKCLGVEGHETAAPGSKLATFDCASYDLAGQTFHFFSEKNRGELKYYSPLSGEELCVQLGGPGVDPSGKHYKLAECDYSDLQDIVYMSGENYDATIKMPALDFDLCMIGWSPDKQEDGVYGDHCGSGYETWTLERV